MYLFYFCVFPFPLPQWGRISNICSEYLPQRTGRARATDISNGLWGWVISWLGKCLGWVCRASSSGIAWGCPYIPMVVVHYSWPISGGGSESCSWLGLLGLQWWWKFPGLFTEVYLPSCPLIWGCLPSSHSASLLLPCHSSASPRKLPQLTYPCLRMGARIHGSHVMDEFWYHRAYYRGFFVLCPLLQGRDMEDKRMKIIFF